MSSRRFSRRVDHDSHGHVEGFVSYREPNTPKRLSAARIRRTSLTSTHTFTMIATHFRAFATTLGLIGLLTSHAHAQAISVGRNVQVSKAYPRDEQQEVYLGIDPNNPLRMIACTIIVPRGAVYYQTQVYMSFDGGKTWEPKLRAIPEHATADPGCAIGTDGTAYFSTRGAKGREEALILYSSTDDGKTWKETPHKPFFLDPLYVVVDDSKSSKFRGRVYLFGASGARNYDNKSHPALTVWRSENNGVSLNGPYKMVHSTGEGFELTGSGAVFSDGAFVIAVNEIRDMKSYSNELNPTTPNARILVTITNDGGETFTAFPVSPAHIREFATVNPIPVVAVDRSDGPFKDRMYVAWTDVRSGRAEIWFTYSTDRGKSWSTPVTVNDDVAHRTRPGPDDHMPTLAVNKDGVVGITWYDRREAKDNLGWRTRFAASVDGGETFSASVPVAEGMATVDSIRELELFTSSYSYYQYTQPRTSPIEGALRLARSPFEGGDYTGLMADAKGVFHALWSDNRTGVLQVWTAPITISGRAYTNGSAELAAFADVSRSVAIDLERAVYDPKTGIASAELLVTNLSNDTLRGAMKVRILGLTSDLGDPLVLDAENGEQTRGALFTVAAANSARGLAPRERTVARRISFRIKGVGPIRPTTPTTTVTDFIKFRATVLLRKEAR
jgi:hypothetical protein